MFDFKPKLQITFKFSLKFQQIFDSFLFFDKINQQISNKIQYKIKNKTKNNINTTQTTK